MSVAAPQTTPTRDRAQIPERYKWNLADLFASEDAWRQAKDELVAEIPSVDAFQGQLATSARTLRDALDLVFDLQRRLAKIYVYASMRSDEDTRESKPLGMRQEIEQVATELGGRAAWLEPEILAMDPATVEKFLAEESGLAIYRHYLDDILRRQAHTGTAGEERLLAEASRIAAVPENLHGLLVDADLPRPEVTLSDGRTVTLDGATFALYRAVENRADRRAVFAAYFGVLHDYRRTLGAALYGAVQRDLFYARARKYGSALESALDTDQIPVAVYHGLVDNVGANLATFHRYLDLRSRILGVEQLHYYDLYAPLLLGDEA